MTQIETRKGIIHYIEAIQNGQFATTQITVLHINITDKFTQNLGCLELLFLPTL